EGKVDLFDWPTGRLIGSLGRHGDLATSAAFSPDESRLAIGSADRTTEIWKPKEPTSRSGGRRWELAGTLVGHTGAIVAVSFSTDGQSLITASADRTLRLWDAGTGGLSRSFSQHTDAVECIAFRPMIHHSGDSAIPSCASGSDDRTVRVWQPTTGRMVR